VARAFPPRPECPDIPDIAAIEGSLVDLSQEVSDAPPPAYEFPAFEFPMPNPPGNAFGCYGVSMSSRLNADSSGVPIVSSSIDPLFEAVIRYPKSSDTGVCQPVFDFNVKIPPCAVISLDGQVSMDRAILSPEISISGGRKSNAPCASDFNFDFRIPCNTININALVSVVPSLTSPQWQVTSGTGIGVCITDFILDLRLPPLIGEDDVCQARMASTGDVTRSGLQTIDGVSGSDGDTVLLKDQSTPNQNGAYLMRSGSWERACTMAGGVIVTVREGDANGATAWMLTTNDPIVVGTTPLTFELISGAACCCYARVATLENITLSGTQTIDGIALSAGEIVLVKNQTDAKQNGPYIVNSGVSPAWERTCELTAGMTVSVREGNTHARQIWMLVTNDPIVVDTTPLSFDIVRAPGNTTVRACADIEIVLSGLQTIDGISLGANDRCLVIGQSTASQNGIYIVQSGAWVRAQADAAIVEGMLVSVREGTTLKSVVYTLLTSAPIIVDTTALTFSPATSNTMIYSVKATSTSNITLSGAQTLDGISCPVGSVVLVRAQSTPSGNGVYRVASGTWTKLSLNTEGLMAVCREGVTYRRLAFFLESNTTTWTGLSAFLQV
jgi:hypothetical protein